MKKNIKKALKPIPTFYRFLHYIKIETEHNVFKKREKQYYKKAAEALLNGFKLHVEHKKEKFPVSSLIEITNACNLNCVMCNTKMSKRPIGFMQPHIFEKILKELQTVGVRSVGLHTVGEPFMYKNLGSLLMIAEDYGFDVWLSTNGQFPQQIQQLYERFPFTANHYRFSIDGAERKTYEFIRRGATFDKLINSLETIHDINKGKINSRIFVSIGSILSLSNIYEIPKFFDIYGRYCWNEHIRFNIVDGLSPDTSFFKNSFPFKNLIRLNIPCHMPFQCVHFTYNGKVTLCCRDYDEEVVIGDIQESPLIEIWNNPRAEMIRRYHKGQATQDNLPCRHCYFPYRSISTIVNYYIHSLRCNQPFLSAHEFGDKVLRLLDSMNSAIDKEDKSCFKNCIMEVFNIPA